MDLTVRSTAQLNEDQSWLASAHGTNTGRPIELDMALFTEGTHFPDGFIPSGTALGKVTASGKYGPYGASPSEAQTLTFDATGGTATITLDGFTFAAYTYLNTSGDTAGLTALLETHPSINPGDVTVTRGTPAGAVTIFTVEFVAGVYGPGENVPQMTSTESLTGGSGTLTHGTTTAGGGAGTNGLQIGRGFLLTSVSVPDDLAAAGDVPGALFWHGAVKEANLPIAIDQAFRDDLAGFVRFE